MDINYNIHNLKELIILLRENIDYVWSAQTSTEFDGIILSIKELFSSNLSGKNKEQFELYNLNFKLIEMPQSPSNDDENNTLYLVGSVLSDQRIDRNYDGDEPPQWFVQGTVENIKAEYGYYFKLAKYITYLNLFRSEEGRRKVHIYNPTIDFNSENSTSYFEVIHS